MKKMQLISICVLIVTVLVMVVNKQEPSTEKMCPMIACCNDGTRPVIIKIERVDIPETEGERACLEKQDFSNSADKAYTG